MFSCYGEVALKGPMTYGTTQGDSESPFLHLLLTSRPFDWLSDPQTKLLGHQVDLPGPLTVL